MEMGLMEMAIFWARTGVVETERNEAQKSIRNPRSMTEVMQE